jgi:hypothetical protein
VRADLGEDLTGPTASAELAAYLQYVIGSTRSMRAQARILNLTFLTFLFEMIEEQADMQLRDLKPPPSNPSG